MSLFFCTVGTFVKIPLLDPQNSAYREKIEIMASYVSEIIGKWEKTLCAADGEEKSFLSENLAYSLRKLAEMLPSAKLDCITEQTFYKNALSLSEGQNRKQIKESVELLCSGFAEIQSRLDLGLEPFEGEKETTFAAAAAGSENLVFQEEGTFSRQPEGGIPLLQTS